MPPIKEQDASAFAHALRDASLPNNTINVEKFVLTGRRGVINSIQYNRRDGFELLGGKHQYTFAIGTTDIQTSLQLYENDKGYYRLFCFTRVGSKHGMTFSMNLTMGRGNDGKIALRQRIMFTERHPDKSDGGRQHRAESQRAMCKYLVSIGLQVIDAFDVDLDSFHPMKGRFIGTSADQFLNEFLAVSLIKGHYQGNKDYALLGLPRD